MKLIDLRSDTVTEPTPAMRRAMAEAEVGDDVYREDPTVNRLERDAAELFGREAGLLVTSGTQGNLIALMAQAPRGSEVILGDRSHIVLYEQGGMAALGGIMPRTVPVQADGTLLLDQLAAAIRGADVHFPRTRLIALENTQGTVGGVALSPDYTRRVADLAHARQLRLHIDGARIFNAATCFGVSPAEIVADADSVTFCLSKGLGAPAGSLLLGAREFIDEARRLRKVLGGGMRQAGVLAAAGLLALHEMRHRLQEDHDNAALLARLLEPVAELEVLHQHSNFVFFELADDAGIAPEGLTAALAERGIMLRPYPGFRYRFRAVLHHWIGPAQVERVVATLKEALSGSTIRPADAAPTP